MRDYSAVTRIVAGIAGGRKLEVPSLGTRPTAERVREALFNALESMLDLDGVWVLDLYAGSGALGLEALSRGAAGATFVEADRRAVTVLRRNAATLGLSEVRVRPGHVETVLRESADRRYDVVLADPPYALDNQELTRALTALVPWLAIDALLIVERSFREEAPQWPAGVTEIRSRRYGDTIVYWAQRD